MPRQYYSRVPNNGLYEPVVYNQGHVYIVDDVDPDAPKMALMGREKVESHTYKCDTVRDFFTQYSDFKVHSVRFPKGSKGKHFANYWQQELKDKTSEDLLIVFYHGKAGGEDSDYKWSLSQYPKIAINAYKLIEKIVSCPAHSLFLLDCYLHTHLHEKWSRAAGVTEIIMRPECMLSEDGKVKEHDGDFTELVIDCLLKYIKWLVSTKKPRIVRGVELPPKEWKPRSMITFPEIMKKYPEKMYSKTQRIWLNRTRRDDEEEVKRIKADPNLMRTTGKLALCCVQIQGGKQSAESEATVQASIEKAADVEEDGGIVDDDDEGFWDGDGLTPAPTTGLSSSSGGSSDAGDTIMADADGDENGIFVSA